MVDRLGVEDDTRNKVNVTKNNVTLGKPFIKKVENGHYIGRMLHDMYPTFSKRSGKSFVVPHGLMDIDPEAPIYNQQIYDQIFYNLSKFGCDLGPKRRDIILQTYKTENLLEIIDCLFEIDNHPQGSIGAATRRKLDIRTTFGNKRSSYQNPQLQSPVQSDVASADGRLPQSERKGSVAGQRQMPGSVRGRRGSIKLNPIEDVPQSPFNNRNQILQQKRQQSQQQNNSPNRLLGKEATMAGAQEISVDQLDEMMPASLEACRTSVQFILTSISIAFQVKPKQATALLANNHKVLQHLCIKGGKGANYEQVVKWYQLLQKASEHLVQLINTEKTDVMSYGASVPLQSKGERVNENRGKILNKTFNILKSGFYSRNPEVQMNCGELFVNLSTAVNNNGQEIVDDTWLWLITSTAQPEFKRSPIKQVSINDGRRNSAIQVNDTQEDIALGKDIEQFQYQTGLQAIIYAYQHNDDFLPISAQLLLLFGRHNAMELLTGRLQQQTQNWSVYGTICLDIYQNTFDQPFAVQVIESSGVLKYWALESLNIAETNGEVPLNDRIVALVFLSEVWRLRSQFVDSNIQNASQTIQRILKKAARDIKRTLVVISIELMFRVLESFAATRHPYAPTLYKTLTFLLVEFYWEIDVRELMLKHFITLYANHDNIPIAILVEPLIKQIEISQYHATSFNVFDFEFFDYISSHHKLTVPTGMLLIDSLSKIALSSVFYQKPAIKCITTLVNRFSFANELYDLWSDAFRQILQSLVQIQARYVMHRFHLRNEEHNFFHRLALQNSKGKKEQHPETNGRMPEEEYQNVKTNEKLIVNLLEKLIRCENQDINKELKFQLLDTYIGLQQGLKIDTVSIRYLLKYYTNKIDALIEERAASMPPNHFNIAIPYLSEIHQLAGDKHHGSIHNPGAVDIYGTSKKLALQSMKSPQRATGGKAPPDISLLTANQTNMVSVALPLDTPNHSKVKETFRKIPEVLYDYNKWEEEWEIKQYNQFLKKHVRLYRQLHTTYSTSESAKKPNAVDKATFNQYEKVINQISAQSLFRLIKDFKLEFGHQHVYLKEETNRLIKAINIHIMKEPGTVQDLTYDGFVHFLLQYAHYLWKDEKDIRSFALVERLFDHIKAQPKFKELGLVMSKTETTNRKDTELLSKIEQRIIQDHEEVPLNHKLNKESQKFVEYLVPSGIPIPPHKKICIELMDEILFRALGTHFLEPIAQERTVVKVVPTIASRRHGHTHIVQSHHVNPAPLPIKGLRGARPLSYHQQLTAEQEEAKKRYEDHFEKKASVRPGGDTSATDAQNMQRSEAQKREFKAQALNRRAKEFGDAIQMTIIEEPMPDKQIMFECGEVLNEVLKAVDTGKKALRLDYTPYRIYDLYKRKLPQNMNQTIEEESVDISDDEDTKAKKKQNVKEFLDRHSIYLQGQREKKAKEKKDALLHQEKSERLRHMRQEEYHQIKDDMIIEDEKGKQNRLKQKQDYDKQTKQQVQQYKDKQADKVKERVEKYKHDLHKKEQDIKGNISEGRQMQEMEEQRSKMMGDRWSNIHKRKLEEVDRKKTGARDQFYSWVKSPPMQSLLNKKYKKGLFLKYEQCLKISKTQHGVTQAGWLEWHRQQGLLKHVDAKQLIRIHSTQVKEMMVVDEHQYNKVFHSVTRDGAAIPGDLELSYGAFAAAMIKVSNLQSLMEEDARGKPPSKVVFKEYGEYQIPDQAGIYLDQFLRGLNVAAAKVEEEPYQPPEPAPKKRR